MQEGNKVVMKKNEDIQMEDKMGSFGDLKKDTLTQSKMNKTQTIRKKSMVQPSKLSKYKDE